MPSDGDINVGGVVVRPHEHALLVQGREVALTPREFEILLKLAQHPGWVCSASQLAEDDNGDYSPESVSVHVARLRHKLLTAGARDAVETVRGIGYRLRAGDGDARTSTDGAHAEAELREAAWQLAEAVLEATHSATPQQQTEMAAELERARRAVYSVLAE